MENAESPELVSILPDYVGVSISHNIFWYGILIILVIVMIIVVIGVSLGWYTSNKSQLIDISGRYDTSMFSKSKIVPNVRYDIGSSNKETFNHISNGSDIKDAKTCESVGYRSWIDGKCVCKDPFWGSSCERQLHSTDYIDIGNFIPSKDLPIIAEYNVDTKAYKHNPRDITCESKCAETHNCVGYIYEEIDRESGPINRCKLLHDEPTGDAKYNLNMDGNLYLHKSRSSRRPKLPHKLYLFTGKHSLRFWEKDNDLNPMYSITNIDFDRVNKINFLPEQAYNDADVSIVYSSNHFTTKEAREVEREFKTTHKQRSDWYVHVPGVNSISPPYTLFNLNKSIWVMGISNQNTDLRRKSSMDSYGQSYSITMDSMDHSIFRSEWSN